MFAGPNNTGKSFVSKLLYSLYHAMREDYAENHIYNLTQSLRKTLNDLIQTIRDKKLPLHSLTEEIKVLEQRIEALENGSGVVVATLKSWIKSFLNSLTGWKYTENVP